MYLSVSGKLGQGWGMLTSTLYSLKIPGTNMLSPPHPQVSYAGWCFKDRRRKLRERRGRRRRGRRHSRGGVGALVKGEGRSSQESCFFSTKPSQSRVSQICACLFVSGPCANSRPYHWGQMGPMKNRTANSMSCHHVSLPCCFLQSFLLLCAWISQSEHLIEYHKPFC